MAAVPVFLLRQTVGAYHKGGALLLFYATVFFVFQSVVSVGSDLGGMCQAIASALWLSHYHQCKTQAHTEAAQLKIMSA